MTSSWFAVPTQSFDGRLVDPMISVGWTSTVGDPVPITNWNTLQ